MSKLKFTDGEEFETSGPLRTEKRKDGWYVLGEGKLIPVEDEEEGLDMIDILSDTIRMAKNALISKLNDDEKDAFQDWYNMISDEFPGKDDSATFRDFLKSDQALLDYRSWLNN